MRNDRSSEGRTTRNSSVRDHLAEFGLEIPDPQLAPPGVRLTYRRLVKWGDVVWISGHGPTRGSRWGSALGKVGDVLTIDEGVSAEQLTALNVLGTIEREFGSLDNVARWLKVTGYVNAVPGFTHQAQVVNGFSDLLLTPYGQDRLAAGSAVGVADLPFGMPVEVDAVLAWVP
jgi:enamine deaminase RidA (YjgF/YER057c/UK114 family)